MHDLRLGTRPAHDEMAEVELVHSAVLEQESVAHRHQHRVRQHVVGERRGLSDQGSDMPGLVAEEPLQHGADVRHLRIGLVDVWRHVGKHPMQNIGGDHPVDDDRAVGLHRLDHRSDGVG